LREPDCFRTGAEACFGYGKQERQNDSGFTQEL